MAIHESSGNVFDDLGFDAPESMNLRVRSLLMMRISRWIEVNEFTQKEAAIELDVSQSRISDLMTGKIQKFTVDNLLNLFSAIGGSLEPKETRTSTTLKLIDNVRYAKAG